MASKIKVDQIEGSAGSSITIPSGQTFTITDGLAASTIGSGTLADARIPNLNASKITAGTIATARLGSGTASSSTFLRGDGTFAAVGGGGKVLQVVSSSGQPSVSTTSTSYVHLTNIPTFNITPAATSSKILLIANFGSGEIAGNNGYISIFRGSTNLGHSTNGFSQVQHSSSHRISLGGAVYLDSPSTTSQITYDIRIKTSNSDNFSFGESCSVNLIAMEIGA